MVTVTIGSDSRAGEEADPQWVTQEINRRRQDGQALCVRVQIHDEQQLDSSKRTHECPDLWWQPLRFFPGRSQGARRVPPLPVQPGISEASLPVVDALGWNENGLHDHPVKA